jgi:hypothetical protein
LREGCQMAFIERTASPRFKSALTFHELEELYYLTEEDLEFVGIQADDLILQLTRLARLKCPQHLGYLQRSRHEAVTSP